MSKRFITDDNMNYAISKINLELEKIKSEALAGNAVKDEILLRDIVTGDNYALQMKNGTLEQYIVQYSGIVIDTLPTKTNYSDTDIFNPAGMVVKLVSMDGTMTEITDYTYSEYVSIGSDVHVISYTEEGGYTHTATVPITTRPIEDALVDFEYTKNSDGTYTLTAWKGTLNGVSSSTILVPNSGLIRI